MGPKEKDILEAAKEKKDRGNTFRASKRTPKQSLKRCVEKDWLRKVDVGEFYLTEEGESALEDRKERDQNQQGLGDFS
jgi:repressor of nif and glnA expression